MTKTSVSAPQFFSLIYLSVLSSAFMYISSPKVQVAETEALLRPVVFIVVSIIIAVPSYLVYKKYKSGRLNSAILNIRFMKVIAVFYAVAFFISALRVVARFDLFASSELFPGNDMTWFIIGLVIACAMLSTLGLGALARAAGIFVFIVVCTTGLVMFSLVDEIDILNFSPLFEGGVLNFFSDSLIFVVQAAEIGAIILFLPEIKGNLTKNYIWWAVLSGLSFIGILFFVIGSLGAFADTRLFPTYTAVTLAEFGLLERMDALETAIWILCVVEKLSFYFLIIMKSVGIVFPKIPKKVVVFIVAVVVGGTLIFISGNLEKFDFVSYMPLVAGVYVVTTILLPVSVLILSGRVKSREKSIKAD